MKIVALKLTVPECNHISVLLWRNHEDETYSGNRQQYWMRHRRIQDKLDAALAKNATVEQEAIQIALREEEE